MRCIGKTWAGVRTRGDAPRAPSLSQCAKRSGAGRAATKSPYSTDAALSWKHWAPAVRTNTRTPCLLRAVHPVVGFGPVKPEHALGLLGEVPVRAPLPRARALMRQARAAQRLAQRLLAEHDPQPGQMLG